MDNVYVRKNVIMYSEIEFLKQTIRQYAITISDPVRYIRNDLFFVTLSVANTKWDVLVDDEFTDFEKGSQTLRWFLVLFSLDLYNETEDILEWSQEHNIPPQDFISYYKNLPTIYSELETIVGNLDPQISDFDYTLRAGAYQELTRNIRSH